MKFRWLIITCLSFFFFSTPAYAGKLLFWRFESNQNRLIFTTDQRVQPTAQLIANPTRLIIDLPGTILGRPTVNQNFGGAITSLRIGQFDAGTTRLVIELAPGYTLDPQQIKIKGISPTQWTVELPNPQRITNPSNPSNPSNTPYNQSNNNNYTPTPIIPSTNNSVISNSNINNNSSSSPGLRVTTSGLLVDINGTINNKINVKRSRDRRKIEFELQGITLPAELPKEWNINQYGISQIEISQNSRNPSVTKLTLNVAKDSPDWQASFSRMGGLLLWPQGGMNILSQAGTTENTQVQPTPINSTPINSKPPSNITPRPSYSEKTLIDSIEVNNTELLIRANQKLQARGSLNSSSGIYELRIDNATLSPQFKSPQLRSNSPISRLRIWQPDSNTVIILAQPALGVKVAQFNQWGDQLVALSLTRYSSNVNPPPVSSFPPSNSQNPWDITPIQTQAPPRQAPPVRRGKTLVVIDPGHGGKDPGAIGIRGIQEKQIVMAISLEVARILEQQGIQVRLTRNSDYFISLEGRTDMASRLNADIFVSIHANSAGSNKPQVNGLETYYFQSGRNLAAMIHRNVLSRVDVNDRKVRQARFYVLRKSEMPSVLVETGFVTGSEDSAKLSNPSYQKQMAAAIAAGIIEYIRTNRL